MSDNFWTTWFIPSVAAAAAFVAAVFGILGFLAVKYQTKLQQKQIDQQGREIDIALETLAITKDQSTKADAERCRHPRIAVTMNHNRPDEPLELFTDPPTRTGQLVPFILSLEARNDGDKEARGLRVTLRFPSAIRDNQEAVSGGREGQFWHDLTQGGYSYYYGETAVLYPKRELELANGNFLAPSGHYDVEYKVLHADSAGDGERGTFLLQVRAGP